MSSGSKTAQGVDISGKVAATLDVIVTKARHMDELAAEVAGASREQTQGITQINGAVGQMDKVTQSNATNAAASAVAAKQLNAQAELMTQTVGELQRLVGAAHASSNAAQRMDSALTDRNLAPLRRPELKPFAPRVSRPQEEATSSPVAARASSKGARHQQEIAARELKPATRLNCWEFKNCGREAGGAKAAQLGICPAYPDHGHNCTSVAGTLCGGKVQGSFAAKLSNCMKCDFYNSEHFDRKAVAALPSQS